MAVNSATYGGIVQRYTGILAAYSTYDGIVLGYPGIFAAYSKDAGIFAASSEICKLVTGYFSRLFPIYSRYLVAPLPDMLSVYSIILDSCLCTTIGIFPVN